MLTLICIIALLYILLCKYINDQNKEKNRRPVLDNTSRKRNAPIGRRPVTRSQTSSSDEDSRTDVKKRNRQHPFTIQNV